MFRNEQEIAPIFLAHIRALFDMAFLVDHDSRDSTWELLMHCAQDKEDFYVYSNESSAYHQKQISNLMCREAFSKGADFVLFLDSDEFLPVSSRKELETILQTSGTGAVAFKWKNAILRSIPTDGSTVSPDLSVLVPNVASEIGKVAISRRLHEEMQGNYEVDTGNHFICGSDKNPMPVRTVGDLIHLPIRSRAQLARKCILRGLTRIAKKDPTPGESFHVFDMLSCLSKSEFTDDQIRYFSFHYSERYGGEELSAVDLDSGDFSTLVLSSLPIDTCFFESASKNVAPKVLPLEKLVSGYLVSWHFEDAREFDLIIDGQQIRAVPNQNAMVNCVDPEEKIARLETAIEKMKFDFAQELNHVYTELMTEAEVRGSVLDKKRSELRCLREEIDGVRSVLNQKDVAIAEKDKELEKFAQEISILSDRLDAIQKSRSWKLTRPIRDLSSALKHSDLNPNRST